MSIYQYGVTPSSQKAERKLAMRDYVNEHFRAHPNDIVRPAIKLKDGRTLSVQASANHYCSPRESWESQEGSRSIQVPFDYTAVEVLASFIGDWKRWIEGGAEESLFRDTFLYPWIPVDVVNKYIDEHGLGE